MMVRVLIVDDHPIVREGLTALLRRAAIDAVGQADTGRGAVESVAACTSDVVLMDLSMPEGGGIEAAREIRARHPNVAVVVLTSFADRDRVLSAVDAGVSGYLLKDDDPEDLIRGIRAAADGQSPVSPKIAGLLLGARAERRKAEAVTTREREVLELVADGLSNKEIARRLGISEKTVKTHLTSAFQRIGVRDRTQAALWFQRYGQQ